MRPASLPPTPRPWIVAHRGDSAHHPENTLASFRAAIEARCDAIELDLRLDGDGDVVVCHDADLSRFGGGSRPILRSTTAELRMSDVGSWMGGRSAAPPMLSEVLPLTAQAVLMLELKPTTGSRARDANPRLCRRVVEIVRARTRPAQVRILSFSQGALDMVHDLDQGLACVRNCTRFPSRLAGYLRDHVWITAIDVEWRHLDAEAVALCHAHGVAVYAYTVNCQEAVERALMTGIDGIIGDDPGWLRAQVSSRLT